MRTKYNQKLRQTNAKNITITIYTVAFRELLILMLVMKIVIANSKSNRPKITQKGATKMVKGTYDYEDNYEEYTNENTQYGSIEELPKDQPLTFDTIINTFNSPQNIKIEPLKHGDTTMEYNNYNNYNDQFIENFYEEPTTKATATVENKAKKTGTSRFSITKRYATICCFVAKFHATTPEAISNLLVAENRPSHLKATGKPKKNGNISESTAKQLANKLVHQGYLTRITDPATKESLYGITKLGAELAKMFDPDCKPKTAEGTSMTHLHHSKIVALTASQLVNPVGSALQNQLGITAGSIKIWQLINERATWEGKGDADKRIAHHKAKGEILTIGDLRERDLNEQIKEYKQIQSLDRLLIDNPLLWNIAHPAELNLKGLIKPDLIVYQDENRTDEAKNILIEVELSRKSTDDYIERLQSFKRELKGENKGKVYDKVVYIVANNNDAQAIAKADLLSKANLIDRENQKNGKLQFHILKHNDGTPITRQTWKI